MSVLIENSPVLAWIIAVAPTDLFVSALATLTSVDSHTAVRLGLLELRVYHVLLRICTEPSKETSSSL